MIPSSRGAAQVLGGDEVTRAAEGGLASVHAFQHLGAQLSEYVRLIQQLRVEAVTSLVLRQPPQNQLQVFCNDLAVVSVP